MTLRRQPSDFVVDELPHPALLRALRPAPMPLVPGAHADELLVLRVAKQSLTTPEAIARVARALGAPAGQALHAGLKDKHAHTTQVVGVPVRAIAHVPTEVDWQPAPGVRASVLGVVPGPWKPDEVSAGNRFTIVVRGLSAERAQRIDRHAHALDAGSGELLFTNYFGDQRFGSARHGQGFAAPALIRGDFLEALRLLIASPARKDSGSQRDFTRLAASHWGEWTRLATELPPRPEKRAIEALASGQAPARAFAALPHLIQQMALDSFQSWLWNDTARRMLRSLAPASELFAAPDEFGELVFAPADAIVPAWRGLMVPPPHAGLAPVLDGAREDAPPWRAAMGEALEAQGVRAAMLTVPGLRRPSFADGPDRPLFARATGVVLGAIEPDELAAPRSPNRWRRTLTFELGRGSFATTLLRALGE